VKTGLGGVVKAGLGGVVKSGLGRVVKAEVDEDELDAFSGVGGARSQRDATADAWRVDGRVAWIIHRGQFITLSVHMPRVDGRVVRRDDRAVACRRRADDVHVAVAVSGRHWTQHMHTAHFSYSARRTACCAAYGNVTSSDVCYMTMHRTAFSAES